LSGGKVVGSGAPAALADASREDVRQFMHGLPDGPVPFHYPAPDYDQQLRQVR
jgi:phospholipid/cholesterol/gamma-HCH transport system ATP-binding protein